MKIWDLRQAVSRKPVDFIADDKYADVQGRKTQHLDQRHTHLKFSFAEGWTPLHARWAPAYSANSIFQIREICPRNFLITSRWLLTKWGKRQFHVNCILLVVIMILFPVNYEANCKLFLSMWTTNGQHVAVNVVNNINILMNRNFIHYLVLMLLL